MKVLVACEFSGTVRDAFVALGHDAMSCDLLPTDKGGPHYQGDIRDVLHYPWDLMIAHPPCTNLSVSGAAHFAKKKWGGAAGFCLVLHAPRQGRHTDDRCREPCVHHVVALAQTRPDHSAVAVWARRNKSYLSLAQEPSEADADGCCFRPRAAPSLAAPVARQMENTQPHIQRYRQGYGRAMGRCCIAQATKGDNS